LFARLRDQLGTGAINLTLAAPTTVQAMRLALQQQFTEHADSLAAGQALVAINQSLCNDETMVINSGDEVALFPPMTGG
ncbi:MoaD/ThiS family protein, partial [Wenyingzhuangia sp. 1_MG-2023]|nr:MoaD/ThiS family protein [Wenyingzhuangia sp. 1_MG-2023]